MSTITDVSGKLGEYMLKGWVLTDKSCPTRGCAVPLMRSPAGIVPVTHFCANCDGGPKVGPSTSERPKPAVTIPDSAISASSISSSSHISRASTPPTELSSTLSSPTFAPPVDTQESLRRRQQSDQASAEIGRRLLKGWAMLAEECPSAQCYGVPLVRPPKAGGKDPRKECVICGTTYITETDPDGWERLVPSNASAQAQALDVGPSGSSLPTPSTSRDKGKAVIREEFKIPEATTSESSITEAKPIHQVSSRSTAAPVKSIAPVRITSDLVMEESIQSLEVALHSLSNRLTALSSGPAVDPTSIAVTADAIGKVASALTQVRQLHWREGQAL